MKELLIRPLTSLGSAKPVGAVGSSAVQLPQAQGPSVQATGGDALTVSLPRTQGIADPSQINPEQALSSLVEKLSSSDGILAAHNKLDADRVFSLLDDSE